MTYDSSTGVYTFTNGGVYSLNLTMNPISTASNKNMYFYAEENTGSGWVVKRYSARTTLLKNTTQEQRVFTALVYFAAGTQTRHYVWGESATITLNSVDLPGTPAGTITVPALRVSWAGGL